MAAPECSVRPDKSWEPVRAYAENRTETEPIGDSSKSMPRSPASRNIGGVSDPQMMKCPLWVVKMLKGMPFIREGNWVKACLTR